MFKRHTRRPVAVLAALALLLLAGAAEAQWTSWTERDGLFDSEIFSMGQDDEGTMWIASFGGVNSFNGVWEETQGLPKPYGHYQSVLVSEDLDGIWVATEEDGLVVYQEGDTLQVNLNGRLPKALLLDVDGIVWAATDSGVVEIDPVDRSVRQHHTVQSTLGGLPDNRTWCLYQDSRFGLWVGTENGAAVNRDGWNSFTINDGLAMPAVQAIAEDITGHLWFGHGEGSPVAASRFDPGLSRWTTYTAVTSTDGLPDNSVEVILRDEDGSLWFGTSKGISHLVINAGTFAWEHFTTDDGLADNQVNAIYQDRDGALWFGTLRGLTRFATLPSYTSATTGGGLPFNVVSAIDDDLEGSVWFGTRGGGLGRFFPEEDRWETHTAASTGGALGQNEVLDLFVSDDGVLWAGTSLGLSRFDGLTWERYLPSRPVSSVDQTREGLVWAVVDGGLAEYDGASWEPVQPPASLGQLGSVFRANDGAMWIGGQDGVARRDPISGTWKTFTTQGTPGVRFDFVNLIAQDSTDTMWFLSADGRVLTYDAFNPIAPWESITKDDGLISNFINTLAADRDGVMWFGAFSGAARFDGENWQTYTTDEGLVNNGVNAIHAAADGSIWFGTDGGATGFSRPPNSLVETRITSTIPNPLPVNRIFVEARGFEVGAEGLPPLSYQLTGFQGETVSATSLDPTAGWTPFEVENASGFELRPDWLETGAWSLYVRAIDRNGRIDPTPEQVDFVVDLIPPTVVISNPRQDESVTGTVSILGAAFDNSPDFDSLFVDTDDGRSDFRSYQLEYARDGSQNWQTIAQSTSEVDPTQTATPVLGQWDTSDLFGFYKLRVTATDTLDHVSQFEVRVKVVSALESVIAKDGGELESASSPAIKGTAALRIPQNGLERDITVEITYLGEQPGVGAPPNAGSTGIIYEIGPDSLAFDKGSTLILGFDDTEVVAADAASLAVYARGSGWAETGRIGGTAIDNEVAVRIDEPGVYGLFVTADSGTQSGVLDIDVQPRAFAPNGSSSVLTADQADIMFELGKAGPVDVRVYDLGGNLVRDVVEGTSLNAGWNTIQWDGRDRNNDVVTSGLYIVVVQSADGVARKTVGVLNRN